MPFRASPISRPPFGTSMSSSPTPVPVRKPVAVSWAGNNIQVFARRHDNRLYHMWTDPDPYHWNQGGWMPLGEKRPFAGDPVAVSWAGNGIQVFAHGNDDRLYHMWTTGGDQWNQEGWVAVGQKIP